MFQFQNNTLQFNNTIYLQASSFFLDILPDPLSSIICRCTLYTPGFFLSIFTGSLIHEHYTRECEFGNFDRIKNKKHKKKNKKKTFG